MVVYWPSAITFPDECIEIHHEMFDEWYYQFVSLTSDNTIPEVVEEVINGEITDKP